MSYCPCELHCHTVHSDGDFNVHELQHCAKDDGLALIALTDHNTFSGCLELDDSIIPAIHGIEWTTYFGHMLVLGVNEFVDWRDAVPNNIDEKISLVKAAGGVVGIAHPYQLGSPICTGGRWEFLISDWNQVDYMEIWHEDLMSESSENKKAFKLWTSLLDSGCKISAVYGRDWHRLEGSGHYGCTYLDMDSVSPASALKAIKEGRTVVSNSAKFFFTLKSNDKVYSVGDTAKSGKYTASFFTDIHLRSQYMGGEYVVYRSIKIVTNGGKTALEISFDEPDAEVELKKGNWYRAELWGTVAGSERVLAVTSPIYCE
ncbi:MAG: CehA/McbA family metallohydrolase [Clostridiales bacterium]|nr:CehA/McbA family metallohydrolase [Clostridiales bacterium]